MNEILTALKEQTKDIKELKELVKSGMKSQSQLFNETWLDNQDIAMALHLSKRTLQTFRDNGTLPYSKLQNKFYYKVEDIRDLLESHYMRNYKGRKNER